MCAQKRDIRYKTQHAKIRGRVITAYGGRCACCGETEPKFLTLDHKNNDGAEHRRQINSELKAKGRTGGRSYTLLKWAIDNNYPDTLQILCYNCNCGKERNGGTCPHVSNSIICLTFQPFLGSELVN